MGGECSRVVDAHADGAHALRSAQRPYLNRSLRYDPRIRPIECSVVEAVGFRDAFGAVVGKSNALDSGKQNDSFHLYTAFQSHRVRSDAGGPRCSGSGVSDEPDCRVRGERRRGRGRPCAPLGQQQMDRYDLHKMRVLNWGAHFWVRRR